MCVKWKRMWDFEDNQDVGLEAMLAIGAGFTGKNLAERMVEVFLSTDFEGGRHERRVNKLNAIQP